VVLPIALLTFFVPASIQSNFAGGDDRGEREELKILLHRLVQARCSAILSLWGSLTIAAMALDIAVTDGRTAGAVGTRPAAPRASWSRS
jgi:hypothetical protein